MAVMKSKPHAWRSRQKARVTAGGTRVLRRRVERTSTSCISRRSSASFTEWAIATMPYRILCNGTFQKSQEARSGLGLASPHRTSLHNNRYGVEILPLSYHVYASLGDGAHAC